MLATWLVVVGALGVGLTFALLRSPPSVPANAASVTVAPPALAEAGGKAARGEAAAYEPMREVAESPAPDAPIEEPLAAKSDTREEAVTVAADRPVQTPTKAAAETTDGAQQPSDAPEQTKEAAEDTANGDAQVAGIPVIPPAPEQLAHWERYRQPFNMDDPRPRIAVVLTGLGLSDSATEAAINKLPAAVTLSFSPYARDLERWIALARARGHEVMLDLPMEPATFPNEDPGPQGLLTQLTVEENLDRLDWVLSRGSAYVGLAGAMGSRFTTSRSDIEPILRDVNDRGLIFVDPFTTEDSVVSQVAGEIGLPSAVNNRSIDERQASRVAIDARLAQVERIALSEGYAVAMAHPYPVTLERLSDWATELTARGFAIAPISALADQQTRP